MPQLPMTGTCAAMTRRHERRHGCGGAGSRAVREREITYFYNVAAAPSAGRCEQRRSLKGWCQ